VVQVDRRVPVVTDFVGVDQAMVITLAIDHLESLGRTRIAFLSSSDSVSTVAERTAAYRRRLTANPTSRDRVLVGELTLRWGMDAISEMLDSNEPLPDGLVCANDLIALGALQRLRQAGVRVPDDVAITGVDDTVFGQVSQPELTTVRQPVDQLGDEAVGMLLTRLQAPGIIKSKPAARSLVLTPELLVRRSTSPSPGLAWPPHRWRVSQ